MRAWVRSLERIGKNIDELLTAGVDDLVGSDGECSFAGMG